MLFTKHPEPATGAQQTRAEPTGEDATAGDVSAGAFEMRRRATVAVQQSIAFAQIVSLLSRSPAHKFLSLADIEWLVIPPLMTGQFMVAEANAQVHGLGIPVAVALWASVSPDVDKRLSENLNAPKRLAPDEWRSGDIGWLIEIVGDDRVFPKLLQQLGETVWKVRDVKARQHDSEGNVRIVQVSIA